jgi:hypothetical protein
MEACTHASTHQNTSNEINDLAQAITNLSEEVPLVDAAERDITFTYKYYGSFSQTI